MLRPPPRLTRTDLLLPYTPLFRASPGRHSATRESATASGSRASGCSRRRCRSATVRFICRQAIARCRTLRQPTGSRSKSANSSRQPETRGTLLMAHEALLAALDQRRESARRMGGEAKPAKRRERGQLNAEERLRSEEHTSELQSLMRYPY